MSIWLYPYGVSNSANELADALSGRLIRRVRSRYRYRPGHLVLNWGCSHAPDCLRNVPVLNDFQAVRRAVSKQATFSALKDANVPVPLVTTEQRVATAWRSRVVGRDLDSGHSGRGITVYEAGTPIGQHRFYTKYFRKEREFRIHVFNGNIIFEQEKLKKSGVENRDRFIRSHDRGWCFAFNHLGGNRVPDAVKDAAKQAVAALGLNFGAVDIGWHGRNGVVVFEVNTAPGIENTSIQAYKTAIEACQH